jgi:hypothetical protein
VIRNRASFQGEIGLRLESAIFYWCVPLSLTYNAGAVAEGPKVSLKLDEGLRFLAAEFR